MTNRKIVIIGFSFFIVIALCLAPQPLPASQITINSEEQFQFAYKYLEKGEYLKAIIEFERFIYFFPDDPLAIKANYFIGLSNLLDKNYKSAREILGKIAQENRDQPIAVKSLFLIGESYYQEGILREGERIFTIITETYPQSPYKDLSFYRLGWIYLKEGKWQEASDVFHKVDKQDPLFSSSLNLSQNSLLGEDLKYKSSLLLGPWSSWL